MSYEFVHLQDLIERAHHNSVAHGFWQGQDPENVTVKLAKLAMIAEEVGEAVKAARTPDCSGFGEELADICIRVFDLAAGCGINLEQEIYEKMVKNKNRPFMHGKLA